MARYGYFFGDYIWLIKNASSGTSFQPSVMANSVLQQSTKQGILIDHACDGLISFDFRGYSLFASEEADKEIERQNGGSSKIDFEGMSSFILRRCEIMNAHSICLKAAVGKWHDFCVPTTIVSPSNLIYMPNSGDPSQGFSFKSQLDSYRYLARYISEYNANLPVEFDPRIRLRTLVIGEKALRDAIGRLEKCVERIGDGALNFCSLLNQAMSSLEGHDYSRPCGRIFD